MYKVRIFEHISSTQVRLINDIKSGVTEHPVMYLALRQSAGIGSNSRRWEDAGEKLEDFERSNEFFYKDLNVLPDDFDVINDVFLSFTHRPSDGINAKNASIYYASIIKQILQKNKSKCYVKWPNDLYLGEKKFGGLITYKSKNCCVIGVGINQVFAPKCAALIDEKISLKRILLELERRLQKSPSWQEIFKDYAMNFYKNYNSYVKHEGEFFCLKDAKLYQDGSILINNKRIYGLR